MASWRLWLWGNYGALEWYKMELVTAEPVYYFIPQRERGSPSSPNSRAIRPSRLKP